MYQKIRIPQKRYNDIVEKGKIIRGYMENNMENRRNVLFTTMSYFPRREELERRMPQMDMRESLPFIIFYSDPAIYDRKEDEELQETRKFMQSLISKYVDIIEDEDYEQVESITPGAWKSMSEEEREERFEPMILYYKEDEFDSFIKDLEYQKFMGAYGYSQSMYKDGEECPEMIKDLRKIWTSICDF